MSKKFPLSVQFIFNCFLVAVFVNTVVDAAHILTAKEFTFSQSIQIILFSLEISAICFTGVLVLLYSVCLIAKMGRESTFWLLMIIGIIVTVVVYSLLKRQFHQYNDQPTYIVAIAGFSIMVSIASQYQLFHHNDKVNAVTV